MNNYTASDLLIGPKLGRTISMPAGLRDTLDELAAKEESAFSTLVVRLLIKALAENNQNARPNPPA